MAIHLNRKQQFLTNTYVGQTFQAILLNDTRYVYAFTGAIGGVITATAHNYILNTKVIPSVSGGGTLPAPLVAGNTYYCRDITANTFKLSATYGGSAISLTDVGTGTFSITDVALDGTIADVANYVRQEVSSYEGLSIRPEVTISAPIITTGSTAKITQAITLDNSAGSNPVLINAIALIYGGTTARGNTTGSLDNFTSLLATTSINAGQVDSLIIPITI